MATAVTRFEVELPLVADGSPQQSALTTFRANMNALGATYEYDMYRYDSTGFTRQSHFMSGYLTAAQQSTALGYLTTLNSALGFNVLCIAYAVTLQP